MRKIKTVLNADERHHFKRMEAMVDDKMKELVGSRFFDCVVKSLPSTILALTSQWLKCI